MCIYIHTYIYNIYNYFFIHICVFVYITYIGIHVDLTNSPPDLIISPWPMVAGTAPLVHDGPAGKALARATASGVLGLQSELEVLFLVTRYM